MNPFSGNQQPVRYVPQRYVDPVTRIIWELDPSGYYWNEIGIQVPAGTEPPPPRPIPAEVQVDTTSDAVKMNSARAVALDARTYNKNLRARYVDAYAAYRTGRGVKQEPPYPQYRIEDYDTIYYEYVAKDIPVPMPPEQSYNV
jgi:hypothetical protein